ncbi:MAG: DUF3352 domain-containing protein, partial [Planctomycetes bacterium]|nr:DUF3352 domain-containing protein [Planctomycetota bacterium]
MANMASERAGRGLDARNVVLGLLLAACVGLSGAPTPTALAQAAGEVPMEQLLPSDALLVLSAPNLSASKERFKGTALSKIWNEPEVQQFLQGPLAKLREAIEKLKTQAQAEPGINLDEVKALFTGQLTFALLDIRFEDKRRGIPEAAFVAGISDPAKFRQILALIEAKAKEKAAAQGKPLREEKLQIAGVDVTAFAPERGIALCYGITRNMFIATVGKAAMEKMLTGATGGHGKPLAKEASFARMVSKLGESKPEALLFVNVAALLDKLEPQIPDQPKQVIYELGLRGLEGAGGALAFEGRGVRSVLYVHAPHERRGLTKLMSSEPVDKNLLKIIPQTATSGSITRFELAGIWTLVEDIAASVGDQQYRTFQQFVAQAEAGLQMKIKDDLCASLGDEIIAYSALPTTPSPLAMIGDVAILLSVRDRDKAQMCADKVLREVARLAGQQIRGKMPPPPPGGQGGQPQPQGPQWNQQEFGGYNISYVTFPGLPLPIFPSYVVTEKYLILSLSPQTVKNVLTQLKTPGPDVTANPDFKDVTGRIPQTYSALSYTDMKRSFETMYPMAQMFLPMIMTQVQLPIDVAKLPQVQTISQHLFGSANC